MKTKCVLIDSWNWGVLDSDAVENYCSRNFLESKRQILMQTPRNGAQGSKLFTFCNQVRLPLVELGCISSNFWPRRYCGGRYATPIGVKIQGGSVKIKVGLYHWRFSSLNSILYLLFLYNQDQMKMQRSLGEDIVLHISPFYRGESTVSLYSVNQISGLLFYLFAMTQCQGLYGNCGS